MIGLALGGRRGGEGQHALGVGRAFLAVRAAGKIAATEDGHAGHTAADRTCDGEIAGVGEVLQGGTGHIERRHDGLLVDGPREGDVTGIDAVLHDTVVAVGEGKDIHILGSDIRRRNAEVAGLDAVLHRRAGFDIPDKAVVVDNVIHGRNSRNFISSIHAVNDGAVIEPQRQGSRAPATGIDGRTHAADVEVPHRTTDIGKERNRHRGGGDAVSVAVQHAGEVGVSHAILGTAEAHQGRCIEVGEKVVVPALILEFVAETGHGDLCGQGVPVRLGVDAGAFVGHRAVVGHRRGIDRRRLRGEGLVGNDFLAVALGVEDEEVDTPRIGLRRYGDEQVRPLGDAGAAVEGDRTAVLRLTGEGAAVCAELGQEGAAHRLAAVILIGHAHRNIGTHAHGLDGRRAAAAADVELQEGHRTVEAHFAFRGIAEHHARRRVIAARGVGLHGGKVHHDGVRVVIGGQVRRIDRAVGILHGTADVEGRAGGVTRGDGDGGGVAAVDLDGVRRLPVHAVRRALVGAEVGPGIVRGIQGCADDGDAVFTDTVFPCELVAQLGFVHAGGEQQKCSAESKKNLFHCLVLLFRPNQNQTLPPTHCRWMHKAPPAPHRRAWR